jgi:hypothetical protein
MANIMDEFPSKYLKGTELEHHPTVTIVKVIKEPVGPEQEMKPILYVEEYERGIVLNKTNGTNIGRMYGTETDDWPGKTVILGTEMVTFNGSTNPSIRIWPPKRHAAQSVHKPPLKSAQDNQREFAPLPDDTEIPF